MILRELFEGIINNKIPSLDFIDTVEKIAEKKDGVTKKFLDQMLSDFSIYLQEYVDMILKERESDTEVIEEYQELKETDEVGVNFYLIQEYYEDAGLKVWQRDSILRFWTIIYNSIEHAEYLMSDKVTMRDSIGDSYRTGTPGSFFWEVHTKNLSELEVYSRVKEITDGFDPFKVKLLCKDFDLFFHWEMELWEANFSHEEIQDKIKEYGEAGKELPMMGMGDQGGMVVSDYFKPKRKIQRTKPLTEEQKKQQEEFFKEMAESIKNSLNVRKLMDPHGIEFYSLYRLRNLLVQLKAEFTPAELKSEFKAKFDSSKSGQEGSSSIIKAIHWLKGEESLKQFLDSLKIGGLIENREAEEIIQEHFYVDGQEPAKEAKPIKWLIESKYLAYLMDRLGDEFIINIKGSKHKLTASHFINSEGKKLNVNSLSSLLSQINKHSRSTDKSISKIQDIIQKVKS